MLSLRFLSKTIAPHTHLFRISLYRHFFVFSIRVLLTACITADANTSTIAFDSVVFLRKALLMFGDEMRQSTLGINHLLFTKKSSSKFSFVYICG